MPINDADYWNRARRARDKLVRQYIAHPDVSLIDISETKPSGHEDQKLVLRIHVKRSWMQAKREDRMVFPVEQDGIPIEIVYGEYGVEGK